MVRRFLEFEINVKMDKYQNKDWKLKRRGKRVYKIIGRAKRNRLAWLDKERHKWMTSDEPSHPKVQWVRKFKKPIPLDEVEKKKKSTLKSGATHQSTSDDGLDVFRKQGEMLETEAFKPSKISAEEQREMKKNMIFSWLADNKRKREESRILKSKSSDDKGNLKKQKSSDTLNKISFDDSSKQAQKRGKTENKFVTKILKYMGDYLCELRMRAGVSPHNRFIRLLSSPKSTLVDDYKEYHTGSTYKGQFSPLGMDGLGSYQMSHGPTFEGFVIDGKFEGFGRMVYPNGGVVEGTWSNGVVCNPHYIFPDGLHYDINDWSYCQMPDRRFHTEILNGMRAPLNVQLANDHPAREIPPNCLDAGEGFYDPQKNYIFHAITGEVIRIPSKKEGEWIKEHCRKAWDENVPFKRNMYENWFQGSKFYIEEDETLNKEWYSSWFPPVKISDVDLDEVVLTRAGALRQSIIYSAKTHEMDYPTKISEALPFGSESQPTGNELKLN